MSTLKVSLSGTAAHSYDNRTEAVVFSGDPLVLELHCQAPWNAGEPVTCNMMSDGFVVGVYSGTGNIQIPAEDLTSGQYELFFNQNGSSASGYTATVTKVLGSLSDDDMALTLDRNKRIMNTELHMLGVQGDMESEVLDFRFPRYADGIDLSEKIISIHYITFGGNASVDTATNVHTDDEYVYFSWVISSEVTAHVGEVNFAVHCTEVNPEGLLIYSWATQPAKLPVKETVTSIEQIREKNPDAINQWLEIMAKASEALEGYVLGIGPNGVLQWVEQTGGTGGGGTTDHSKLTNRNLANQHSIGAITGLQEALNGKQASGDYALKSEIPTVPTKLSELTGDERHRTVTDEEKQKWNTTASGGVKNASELAATVPDGLTADPNVQTVLDALANLTLTQLDLQFSDDGKLHIYVQGKEVGNGVAIGDIPEQGIELSDGTRLTKIMFADDFTENTVGQDKTWKMPVGHSNAALTSWWTRDPKNVKVENGNLVLSLLKDNPEPGYAWSAGLVESGQFGTKNNYCMDTGYFEVRFKLDKVGPGIWPAIWFVGQTQMDKYKEQEAGRFVRTIHGLRWPWAGEIDQLDAMGCKFTSGLIYQTDLYEDSIQVIKGAQEHIIQAETWYTIGVLKTKSEIKVYWNRFLSETFDIEGVSSFAGMGERIIMNIGTGPLAGEIPSEIEAVHMIIDYAKTYALPDIPIVNLDAQTNEQLIPDFSKGFDCVKDRNILIMPKFASNTQNTALEWISSKPEVASAECGYLRTKTNGTTEISAKTVTGKTAIHFNLTVKDNAGNKAEKIVITSNKTSIAEKGSETVTAKIYPQYCDELTPTLSVVSGGEWCRVDGQTVFNTNTSGSDKHAVIRIGTNNSDVYEDVDFTMQAKRVYDLVPDTNVIANYNISTVKRQGLNAIDLLWEDGAGKSKTLFYSPGSVMKVTGNKIVATNSIWYPKEQGTIITDAPPKSFTALLLFSAAEKTDDVKPVNEGNKLNAFDSSWEWAGYGFRNQNLFVYQQQFRKNVKPYSIAVGVPYIVGEIYNAGNYSAVGISMDGTVTKTTELKSVYNDQESMEVLYAFNGLPVVNNNCGMVGDIYQLVVFDKALTDEELKSFASQMFKANGIV